MDLLIKIAQQQRHLQHLQNEAVTSRNKALSWYQRKKETKMTKSRNKAKRRYLDNALFLDITASFRKCCKCLCCRAILINKTPWSWSNNKVTVKTLLKYDSKTVNCLLPAILFKIEKRYKLEIFNHHFKYLSCYNFFAVFKRTFVDFTSACNLKKLHAGVSFTSGTCNSPLRRFLTLPDMWRHMSRTAACEQNLTMLRIWNKYSVM